jgi:hypothetical protein
MLAKYFPGRGLCYLDSVNNVKQKLKNADTFRRKNRAVCIIKCFNKPTLSGDSPTSIASYLVNGGTPLDGSACYIDGGYIKVTCFDNPILTGNSPSSVPTYMITGGSPSSSPSCYINGGNVIPACYTNPILTGDSPLTASTYTINGGTPSSIPTCYIDGGHL